jgi:hypothetical protein
MAANQYLLRSTWRVTAPPEEVCEILRDAASLPRWWSSVYLAVEAEAGDVWRVHSRGRLPYTLRWRFQATSCDGAKGFGLRAWGDLDGTGEWRLVERGGLTEVRFEWRVRADKPLLRRLSWLLKPLFAANHRWAMARGEEGLKSEILRRRLLREIRPDRSRAAYDGADRQTPGWT